MARAHFRYQLPDRAGNQVQGAAVYLFAVDTGVLTDPATGTAITGSMYALRSGGSAIANPLISNDKGEVEAWLDTAQTMDVVVTRNGGLAHYPGNSGYKVLFEPFKEIGHAYHDPADVGAGGGGGAPTDALYVVTAAHASLTAEKILGTDVILRGTVAATPASPAFQGQIYVETDGADRRVLRGNNVGGWDEIARGEVGIRLAQLAEKVHGSLTGVTADQHHPQVHTIDGANHTGDIPTAMIENDAVTYAKIQNVSATDRLLGRDTAGAGDVEEITPAAARTMLDVPTTGEAILKTLLDAVGDLIIASAADTPARLARGSEGQVLEATSSSVAWASRIFSRGGTILDPAGARDIMVWRAPFACTVTNVRGHRKGGTGATVNARKNQASDHLASNLSLGSADAWADGGAVQNTAYAAGDDLEIRLVSIAGAVTEVAIQVDFTRP